MLQYTETYDNPNCIRVDVVGSRDNMSWAILDRSTGQIVRECMRGEFLFPGLTDDELQEAREFIKKLRTAPFKDAYIRFGKLPRSGKSKNYATGQLEDGVSCYSARWNIVSGSYEREGGLDGAAIKYLIKGEPIYLIC